MAAEDKVDVLGIIKVTVIGSLIVYLLILLAEILYNSEVRSLKENEQTSVVRPSDILQRQKAELRGYRWADQAKKKVVIPIDRAIELVSGEEAR